MSEWKEIELDNIAELVKDKYTPQKGDKLHYIGLEHIQEQSLRLKGLGNSDEITSDKFHFNSGDILFGKLRPYLKKVIIPKFDGVCSTDIWVVRSKIQKYDINQRYLFYLFASKEFVDLSDSSASGTRMPRADWKFMRNTIWVIPINETEQKTIADFLDRKTGQIDTLIEKKQQQIELLKEQRTAIINQAVTKGLNPDVTMKDSGWPMVEVGKVCEIKRGSTITKKQIVAGNVPVISGGKQPAYYHNKSNREVPIVTVSSSGAYAGFVNFFNQPIYASDCFTIQSKDKKIVDVQFIYRFLKSQQDGIYQHQQGSALPHVYPKDLQKIKTPLPPLPEQKAIADYLDRKTEQIDTLTEKKQKQIELLSEYRTALITNAVTGTIDIRNEVEGVENSYS